MTSSRSAELGSTGRVTQTQVFALEQFLCLEIHSWPRLLQQKPPMPAQAEPAVTQRETAGSCFPVCIAHIHYHCPAAASAKCTHIGNRFSSDLCFI